MGCVPSNLAKEKSEAGMYHQTSSFHNRGMSSHSAGSITDRKMENLNEELLQMSEQIIQKDQELEKLRAEVHKLKSIIDAKIFKGARGMQEILAAVQEQEEGSATALFEKKNVVKRAGVKGESYVDLNLTNITRHDKNIRTKQLIKDALLNNDVLKNLESNQIQEIIDSMYEKLVKMGEYVIKEGDEGQQLYVSGEGEMQVSKENKVLGTLTAGHAFGELAVLYNCTRTASVQALTNCQLWVIDRKVFQAIMMKTGLEWQNEKVAFLKSVSLLKDLPPEVLTKIADVLEVDFFQGGEYIIRENAVGNTFFIINKGQVQVTQTLANYKKPQQIRQLKRGDYFGEKALLSEDRRSANVIAMDPGVECLSLDRQDFIRLIGSLGEFKKKDYGDDERGAKRSLTESEDSHATQTEHLSLNFSDLVFVATLGLGGFGRVEMVKVATDPSRSYALKCLKKRHIVATNQQTHVYAEKRILLSVRSPFIVRLYQTFRDRKYVYMLMEVCLGGELWSILRDRGNFDDTIARFSIACVVEAFEYLHKNRIVYRDLKPENLLLSKDGYVKLVDFGFAKELSRGNKTWTFCGTPEYVAPEIILNKGHDHAVDYWAIGILAFELLTGSPPFIDSDPMQIYNQILKGVDSLVFPKTVGRTARILIKQLCRDSPAERLGYGKNGLKDIRTHSWYNGFDWIGLKNQTIEPPILPKVLGPTDFSNFDSHPKSTEVAPDETSGWDTHF